MSAPVRGRERILEMESDMVLLVGVQIQISFLLVVSIS